MISNYSEKRRSPYKALLMSAWLVAYFCAPISHADSPHQTEPKVSQPASPTAEAPALTPAEFGGIDSATDLNAVLRIDGKVFLNGQDHVTVDLLALQALPTYSISTSTIVTDGVQEFSGVLMRDVFEHVGADGTMVTATALNGYEVKIPMRDFIDFDVVLAWEANGQPLRVDDKGPFWIVYPRDQHQVLQDIRYDYRWVWHLTSLRVH